MRITQSEINWFCQELQSGRTIEEMAIDTGWSKQNVKRALAEGGLLYLQWHKTKEEDHILKYLRSIGITSLNQLKQAI